MIEGLQGTIMTVMTGGEAIMTKGLTMMTDAGMITIGHRVLGKSEDATRKIPAPSTRGPPGTEMEDGRAKWRMISGRCSSRKREASVVGFILPNLLVLVSTKNWALTYMRTECTFLHGNPVGPT